MALPPFAFDELDIHTVRAPSDISRGTGARRGRGRTGRHGRGSMNRAGPGVPAAKMSVGGSTVVFVRRPSVTARADEHGYGEGPLARPELTLVKPTVVDEAAAGNSAAGSSAGIGTAVAGSGSAGSGSAV